jgi:hypothetical protein
VGRTKITAAMMTTATSAGFHENSFKALFLSYEASRRVPPPFILPICLWPDGSRRALTNEMPCRGGHRSGAFSDHRNREDKA